MRLTSPQFRALMRRNLLYRRRYFVSLLLELALPVSFAALLLWIKHLAKDEISSSTTPSRHVPAYIPRNYDAKQILSFSDYVTGIVAKRVCYDLGNGKFGITGIPLDGWDWQIPFVKCDSRRCQQDGEEAYNYCVYPILALAPNHKNDQGARFRAQEFQAYIGKRYPQLKDPELTHFPGGYDFVRMFESNNEIEKYVKAGNYGSAGKEQIGIAVLFEGNDPKDYQYTIRVNSTNFNAPEAEGRPSLHTTPDTNRLFDSFARTDNACTPPDPATPDQGEFQNSCTGQYMYNGFLTTQRLLHDWIMEASGAKDAGVFIAEHGVRYVQFPSKPYSAIGF